MLKDKIKNYYSETRGAFTLGFSLAKANFKLKNAGSYLGIFWYLLNPLALFLIILFIKGAAFSTNHIKFYPAYLLLGIIMYNFFYKTLSYSLNIIDGNSGLIKSTKIKYEALVVSEVLEAVFSHIFEFLLVIAFMVWYKVSLIGIIYYLILFFFFFITVLGLSFLFTTIGAHIKDFSNIWNVIASQVLFFITPIFYSVKNGDGFWLYKINFINPLYYLVETARDLVIYERMPGINFIMGVLIFSFLSLVVGIIVFNKFKPKFAELV